MKAKQKLSPTQRFWKMVKLDAREIRNVYYYSIFTGLVSLSLPLGIQAIVNLIQGGTVSSAWIVLVVFVVIGIALNGVLQIFQLRITENLEQKIFARAAFEFAYRIPRIKLNELFKKYAPEQVNRFFDVLTIQKGISKILITISTAGIQVIFGLILLSLYHEFFIIFGVFLIGMLYFIFSYFGKRGLATSIEESDHKYKTIYWLEEIARSQKTFKLAGFTILPFTKVDKHVDKYLDARERHFKVLMSQYALLVLFKVIVATGLLAIGGILVMEQVMNIGQFVAAEIIIVLIINSVEKLIVSIDTIYDVLTGMEKIGKVSDMELEKSDGIDLQKECTEDGLGVNLDKVYFTYPEGKHHVLKNIEYNIKQGSMVMITGQNSSGKTTLLHLIAGLHETSDGVISYNGFPLDNLNTESLRAVVGTCLSEEQLFNATLLENITLGRPNVDFENVKKVVSDLGLFDFIKALPDGYDTTIEPNGMTLPQSIIYKLLIARAIVDKPKLLLFESTFEHFNEKDKAHIVNYLLAPEHKWTIIATSVDKFIAKKSDEIIILEAGKIKQTGTYESLKNEI